MPAANANRRASDDDDDPEWDDDDDDDDDADSDSEVEEAEEAGSYASASWSGSGSGSGSTSSGEEYDSSSAEEEESHDAEDVSDIDGEGADGYRPGGYHPVEVGDVFHDRYEVVEKLGWGHFSTVWMVRDSEAAAGAKYEYVALKVQKSASHYTDAALDEIELLRTVQTRMDDMALKLKEPSFDACLVRLLDHFEHNGPHGRHVCMTFEMLGANLLSVIRESEYHGLPMEAVKNLARQICIALDFLHDKCSIIHTDLKPENILLRTPRHRMLSDQQDRQTKGDNNNNNNNNNKKKTASSSSPTKKKNNNVAAPPASPQNKGSDDAPPSSGDAEEKSDAAAPGAGEEEEEEDPKKTAAAAANGKGTTSGGAVERALDKRIDELSSALAAGELNGITADERKRLKKKLKKHKQKLRKTAAGDEEGDKATPDDPDDIDDDVTTASTVVAADAPPPPPVPPAAFSSASALFPESSALVPVPSPILLSSKSPKVVASSRPPEPPTVELALVTDEDDGDIELQVVDEPLLLTLHRNHHDDDDDDDDDDQEEEREVEWCEILVAPEKLCTLRMRTAVAALNLDETVHFDDSDDGKGSNMSTSRGAAASTTTSQQQSQSHRSPRAVGRGHRHHHNHHNHHHHHNGSSSDDEERPKGRDPSFEDVALAIALDDSDPRQRLNVVEDGGTFATADKRGGLDNVVRVAFAAPWHKVYDGLGPDHRSSKFGLRPQRLDAARWSFELHGSVDETWLLHVRGAGADTVFLEALRHLVPSAAGRPTTTTQGGTASGGTPTPRNLANRNLTLSVWVASVKTSGVWAALNFLETAVSGLVFLALPAEATAPGVEGAAKVLGVDLLTVAEADAEAGMMHHSRATQLTTHRHPMAPKGIRARLETVADDAFFPKGGDTHQRRAANATTTKVVRGETKGGGGGDSSEGSVAAAELDFSSNRRDEKKKKKKKKKGGRHTRSSASVSSSSSSAKGEEGETNDDETDNKDAAPGEPAVGATRPRLLEKLEGASIAVVDLGNACWRRKHFTEDIQTRQYRCPEVIIGASYDTSADIWSLACIVFELLTGDLLFDPRAGPTFDRDEDHLAQMQELLGRFPKKLTQQHSRARQMFNRRGELKHIHQLRFWDLEHVLTQKYHHSPKDAKSIASFLTPMLDFFPNRRATAADCLQHPWLKDTDGGGDGGDGGDDSNDDDDDDESNDDDDDDDDSAN